MKDYVAPDSVEEALDALTAAGPEADVVAGGTDLIVQARIGRRPLRSKLIAIHRLEQLRGRRSGGGTTWLGALTTHAELRRDPEVQTVYSALADGSALVGSHATQNVGTIGGNVVNASPAMDTGSPLLCFDCEIELASASARRILPVAEFLTGPGLTARTPDEIVTGLKLKPPATGRFASAYLRHDYRAAMEVAVVGVAALLAVDDDHRVTDARIALTAVAPVCLRVPQAEALLLGAPVDALPLAEVAALVQATAHPIDDVRATAGYRAAMVGVITRRVLERVAMRVTNPLTSATITSS